MIGGSALAVGALRLRVARHQNPGDRDLLGEHENGVRRRCRGLRLGVAGSPLGDRARSGGGTSRALEAGAVTADATRKGLRAGREGDSTGDGAATAKAILAEAAEIARARHASSIDADHLVLAALNGPDGGALRAVTALGVTPAAVRQRLGC